ncbi:MAG: RES family NAD+ phosphorylase [Ilumatobacteraceae bacterium]
MQFSAVPRRRLTGEFWHQGPTRHELTSCADPARGHGRYHRAGDDGVWYASSQEQAAWAELFRHFVDEGIDPFEVRRRVGRVSVDIEVLDLTDERVRTVVGVDESDLIGDDYAVTQELAAEARAAGFDGVLAPSAALPDRQTLVVFARALPTVRAQRSDIRQPPPRLADLLPLVRPHERVPNAVRRLYRTIAAAGAEAIRARRSGA